MNDYVLNLYPIGANRQIGKVSSAFGSSTFNSTDFCSGHRVQTPSIPKLFGVPPNWGGGWTGSGITGTYYSNTNYTGTSFQRADVRIDMPPTTVLPGGSLSTDPVFGAVGVTNFSVKWIGNLIPKYTEIYILKVKTGGTLTLKISGTTVATATSSNGWVSVSYSFTAGQTYSVEVDMVHGTGPWSAQVHWVSGGSTFFLEEAIGPATPIGSNNEDEMECPANGTICAGYYQNGSFGGTGPAVDASGWPTGDFSVSQMTQPGFGTGAYAFPNGFAPGQERAGIWQISFNGCAELNSWRAIQFLVGHDDGLGRTAVSLNGSTYYSYGTDLPIASLVYHSGTGTGYNSATNTTVVLYDLRNGQPDNLGFKNTDRSGTGAPGGPSGTQSANGITNIVCMKPPASGSTVPLPAGTVIHPVYLASLAPYVCARNNGQSWDLDFVASVASPYTDWGKRPTPIFSRIASNQNQYPQNGALPWEYQVMAANMSGKDLYVNLPQTASGNISDSDYTSSYIYQLANLIKNGSTFNGINYPGLLPHLCVYIEYGNENWNFSSYSTAGTWWGNMVNAANANKQANTNDWQQYSSSGTYSLDSGGTVTAVQSNYWGALKVKDASDLFRIVFGDALMPGSASGYNPDPRIRPILEWQYGGNNDDGGNGDDALRWIASHFNAMINHVYWGGGGGWYSDNDPAGSNANQVFANMTLAGAFNPTSVQGDMVRLSQFGLHHVGYEGGFDFGGSDGPQQASNDSRIKPYVQQTLNQYFQYGGALPVVFLSSGGPYGFNQRWGVIDVIQDEPPYASAPPKLQAYLDSEQSLPPVIAPPSSWVTVPNNFSIPSGFRYDRKLYVYQTFVVTNAGYFSVGFLTATSSNTNATANMAIVIDGTTVGTIATIHSAGGDSLYVSVYLGAGVHSMMVTVANPNPSSGWEIDLATWGVH